MQAALEIILPGNAARAASRLDEIKRSGAADVHQAVDVMALDKQIGEAKASLFSCQPALQAVKDREPLVAEILRQWTLLRAMIRN